MPSIAEQLLRQNLVTAEQAEKAEDRRPRSRRSRRGGKGRGKGEGEDPKRLALTKAIEAHRLEEDAAGDIAFAFTTRSRKQAEMRVSIPTAARLGNGEYAIVERAKDEHVLVHADAVPAIRSADAEAIRYFTGS